MAQKNPWIVVNAAVKQGTTRMIEIIARHGAFHDLARNAREGSKIFTTLATFSHSEPKTRYFSTKGAKNLCYFSKPDCLSEVLSFFDFLSKKFKEIQRNQRMQQDRE
ncbi:MAG: hypothetical protein ACLP0B_13370 [Steroidobacteraceae bacterium]